MGLPAQENSLSFSKKGPKTVVLLETHNRKLRELLDSNDKLDSMKASRKDTTWATIFECIRGHAGSVHTAIKKSWNCSCIKPHVAGLSLQKRSTGDDSDFSMAFNIPEEVHKPPIDAREVIISIKRETAKGAKASLPIPSPSPEDTPAPENYIGKLRNNFTQSSRQLNVVSRPAPSTSLSASPPLQTPLKDVTSNVGLNHCGPINKSSHGPPPSSLSDSMIRLVSIHPIIILQDVF